MIKTVSIHVSGRVQKVGFRYFVSKKANDCMVTGFIQNQNDGSVYIEASGEALNINAFIDFCRKGPSWAIVTRCQISELPITCWKDFEIR